MNTEHLSQIQWSMFSVQYSMFIEKQKGSVLTRGRTLSLTVTFSLVSSQLERCLGRPVIPGTDNRPIIRPDILEFAVGDEMSGSALIILRVSFDMNHPL